MNRAIDIFFYGLFMDRQALIRQGLHPGPDSVASVDGFRVHIGDRATLAPLAGETAWGVVMALPGDEVAQLYGAPSVADYRPEAVLARKEDGETVAALCYNLPMDQLSGANKAYAEALHALATELGLPDHYLAFLEQLTR
ncbi:MAG: gamma-glutamylcyclotransferase [Rhodospirillaceae bacterium]|nr:gamma-glutamylcyclotransferase [Rhodospirillaceae bacterium]MDD9917631.1 gamma-glutamylcyclotransferase [Rhodospirillaceae bacterium]